MTKTPQKTTIPRWSVLLANKVNRSRDDRDSNVIFKPPSSLGVFFCSNNNSFDLGFSVRLLDAKKLELIALRYIFLVLHFLEHVAYPQLIMRKTYLHFFLLGLFGWSAATANAAQLASAKVLSVSGTVTSYTEGGAETPLQAGAILTQGASICTNPSSQAVLVFSNGSELTVMENSRITLAELSQEAFGGTKSYEQLQADPSRSQTLLKLNYGKTSGHVKKLSDGSQFLVETPLGTAAIRGTNFTIALNFNPTSGLYSLQVSNHDGLVDLITKAEGSKENGDYDPKATETSTPIPAGQQFAVSISADDPNFDTVIDQKINLAPAEVPSTPASDDAAVIAPAELQASVTELVRLALQANPDLDLSEPVAVQQTIEPVMAESYLLVPVPTAAEIQIIAETVMMAFMAEIQDTPGIDANAVIANVSSAILTATVAGLEAAAAAAPEGSSTASVTAAITAASSGIVGAAAAASSGTDSFAATVAAASSGATTGAVAAVTTAVGVATGTTSTTEAIKAASNGAVTGAVAATAGSTTSSTEAITAASGGAVTGAVAAVTTAGGTTSTTEAIAAASNGAVTGAVAATEGSTTSSTEAITAASNGATTGAVAAAGGTTSSAEAITAASGGAVAAAIESTEGEAKTEAAQAAASGAAEAAVDSAGDELADQLAALQAATTGATQAAAGDETIIAAVADGGILGATEAGLSEEQATDTVENAVQEVANSPTGGEGPETAPPPVVTPDPTEDDDTTVISPAG